MATLTELEREVARAENNGDPLAAAILRPLLDTLVHLESRQGVTHQDITLIAREAGSLAANVAMQRLDAMIDAGWDRRKYRWSGMWLVGALIAATISFIAGNSLQPIRAVMDLTVAGQISCNKDACWLPLHR